MIKPIATLAITVAGLVALQSHAQSTNTLQTAASTNATAAAESKEEKAWSIGFSASTYIVPDSREYVQPTFTADRGHLHLEARYNYEGVETASLWGGCNFAGGEKLTWELTPMVGGVFGNITGGAVGFEGTLNWWKLELYSEGEGVFVPGNSYDNFFYSWTEFSLWPTERFRFGLVTQRTTAYKSDRDVQRGVLLGFSFRRMDLTGYLFNPDVKDPTWVVTAGFQF